MALYRRASHGRSDAPSLDPRYRFVRSATSPSEWRAFAACCSLEVRIQGDQVHCEDRLGRRSAADDVEWSSAQRIWILRQCESRGGPPPLEPGIRNPHRHTRPTKYADV